MEVHSLTKGLLKLWDYTSRPFGGTHTREVITLRIKFVDADKNQPPSFGSAELPSTFFNTPKGMDPMY